MPSYDKTALWHQALAARLEDPHWKERERLRAAYENVRLRAVPLAEAIAKDLPDYTVHDITHSDALWEYADLISGTNYPINPCESFVLGCAFLVHDLGMGLAAFPEGLAGLKKVDLWKDTVADLLRKRGIEVISNQAIEQAGVEVEKQAVPRVLRRLHSDRADKLALIHWTDPKGIQRFYLIEDPELRDSFGPIIGRISSSHWWPIDQLAGEFLAVMGAPVGFPQSWTVDPLKLACMLRTADYCHIDERRAPAFLRALRQPEGASDEHWKFQGRLYQPRLEDDRLIYTAKSGFSIDESAAWWLCFDTLNSIDCELRKVDSLLADTRRRRFAARGVSQAEEPSRLARLIKSDGWQPVDTRIRVSAVADLVEKLGGKDLYGDTVTPPLREMLQNAADAVRARRIIDGRAADWGEIRVTSGSDGSEMWIQVEDSGVGMSEAVLTGPLLDFGTTFWGSSLMHDQFPGLAAKGFQATGRYGIGFFSVFMWGERVEVVSQRFDKGREDTLVLSFKQGLSERPLLRRAETKEHIPEGGTRVKVWLSDQVILKRLRTEFGEDQELTLTQVCAAIAPCLDVTLKVGGDSDTLETAVTADDWLVISDEALLRRIMLGSWHSRTKESEHYFRMNPRPPLQILRTANGRVLGRVAICGGGEYLSQDVGIVTIGGLSATRLKGIAGVFVGSPLRAARDSAIPIVPVQVLKDWVKCERDARLREGHPLEVLAQIAEAVLSMGVEPSGLPLVRTDSGWVTPGEIVELSKGMNEVLLVHDAIIDIVERALKVQLDQGVFVVAYGVQTILSIHHDHWFVWPAVEDVESWGKHRFYAQSVLGEVVRAFAKGWGYSIKEVLEKSSLDDEEIEKRIGTLADTPYVTRVTIIRRP